MQSILLTAAVAALSSTMFAQPASPAIHTYAPVPPTGLGPGVPPDTGFRVEPFGNGAYMLTDGVYQALFLVTSDSVIMVDAPPSLGSNILQGVRTVTDLPISYVVYSHAHADHIGAAYLLQNQSTVFIAHEETAKALAETNDKARPLPNVTFSEDYELTVGNQTLLLSYKGSNHDPGNIFIYATLQKVLMLVDVIYPGWVPYSRLAESQNIPGWIDAHDQVLEYDFDHMVCGHLNRAGTREDVLIQKEYIADLYNNCLEAIHLTANASWSDVIAANPNNSWALTNYIDEFRADLCVNATNEKWLGRLAGADVYGISNAETMLESLKIDFGVFA